MTEDALSDLLSRMNGWTPFARAKVAREAHIEAMSVNDPSLVPYLEKLVETTGDGVALANIYRILGAIMEHTNDTAATEAVLSRLEQENGTYLLSELLGIVCMWVRRVENWQRIVELSHDSRRIIRLKAIRVLSLCNSAHVEPVLRAVVATSDDKYAVALANAALASIESGHGFHLTLNQAALVGSKHSWTPATPREYTYTEDDYRRDLSDDRELFTWCLMSLGGFSSTYADEKALEQYPYIAPDHRSRDMQFNTSPWDRTMCFIHGTREREWPEVDVETEYQYKLECGRVYVRFSEDEYIKQLEHIRELYAWCLVRLASIDPGEARQLSLERFPAEPADSLYRSAIISYFNPFVLVMEDLYGKHNWPERFDAFLEYSELESPGATPPGVIH